MKDTLESLFADHINFAAKKFPESTDQSSLKGLKKEIKEVEKEGKKLLKTADLDQSIESLGIEYVDCFMYLLDSFSRAGFSIEDLKDLFAEKLEINKERKWKKNKNNTYSHKK